MSENATDTSIQVDVFSKNRTDGLTTYEKIRLILDSVKDENVVVLEDGLTSDEEAQLVEKTMTEIQPDEFDGIEIERPAKTPDTSGGFLSNLMGSDDDGNNITFVAPANKIEKVQNEEGELLSALLSE